MKTPKDDDLAMTAPDLKKAAPPTPTDDAANKAMEVLGYGSSNSVLKLKARHLLGNWLAEPGVAPMLMTTTFTSIDHLERASAVGLALAESKNRKAKDRIAGAALVATVARAHADAVKVALQLSRHCAGLPAPAPTGQNSPPDLALQVNVNVDNTPRQEKPAIET